MAKNLEHAPAFLQQYGSRILLGITLCLLVFILWRNHAAANAQRLEDTAKDMGSALYSLDLLRHLPAGAEVDQLAKTRRDLARDVEDSITRVLNESQDPKVRAEALVARGDLNWQLANFPTLPTTNPDLAPTRSSEDLLKAAEDAYKQVLAAPENENRQAVLSAQFGLAAIAENRQQWDTAKQFYQQIVDDNGVGKEFKDFAQNHIELLTRTLDKPVIIGAAPAAPVMPPAPKPSRPTSAPVLGPQAPAGLPTTAPSGFNLMQTPSTRPSVLEGPSIGSPPEAPSLVPPNPFGAPTTRPSAK